MFTATTAAVAAGVIAMFAAAAAHNPRAPEPGECVSYALYGDIHTKCGPGATHPDFR